MQDGGGAGCAGGRTCCSHLAGKRGEAVSPYERPGGTTPRRESAALTRGPTRRRSGRRERPRPKPSGDGTSSICRQVCTRRPGADRKLGPAVTSAADGRRPRQWPARPAGPASVIRSERAHMSCFVSVPGIGSFPWYYVLALVLLTKSKF